MRLMLTGIFFGFLLLTPFVGCLSVKTQLPPTPFQQVCSYVQENYPGKTCVGLKPPTTVITLMVDEMWLNGSYYPGEQYIFINPRADDIDTTILHETGHYVLDSLELIDKLDKCEHERVVRLIAGQEWDDGFRRQYGCPIK